MGVLAQALRDPRMRSCLRTDGGNYRYDNPVELVEDMVALKRAFPDIRLLANDDQVRTFIGYIGYRTEGDREVVFYFRISLMHASAWLLSPSAYSVGPQQVLVERFRSSEGRRQLIQLVNEISERPEVTQEEPKPRRSAWDRLNDDDEPL